MTDRRVPPCTAFRELPGLDAPRALSHAGNGTHPLSGDTFVHCVLGEHQGGEHAGPIGDQDDTPQTLWLLWTQTGYRLEWRASCGAESSSSTCWFHHPHSNSSHAWHVADPVREAIRTLPKPDDSPPQTPAPSRGGHRGSVTDGRRQAVLPSVRPPLSGSPIIPVPMVGEPFRPTRVDECPAGGSHQYQEWSAKMRCVKCGATQG